MQKLILIITAVVLASWVCAGFAQVKEFDGPYGLKALVVDRNGEKIFAWKVPHTDAKLLFVGSIYDGNEDLTFRFSRKLLGSHKLETGVAGIEIHVQESKKLYIFFDPACDSCQLLFQKFNQEPPGCTLVWVPVQITPSTPGQDPGTQWLMSAMAEGAQQLGIEDDPQKYQKIKDKNYGFIRWMTGLDEAVSVPMFAWEENGEVQLKMGDEMTGGKLEQVIETLKGGK